MATKRTLGNAVDERRKAAKGAEKVEGYTFDPGARPSGGGSIGGGSGTGGGGGGEDIIFGVESIRTPAGGTQRDGDIILESATVSTVTIADTTATDGKFTFTGKSLILVNPLPATGDTSIVYKDTSDNTLWWDSTGAGDWVELGAGSAGMVDFVIDADGGTPQTVEDGETVTITGGTGIDTVVGATNEVTISVDESEIDHGGLAGLTDDDHTQYALLAGRATGQTLTGGTGSGESLNLRSTSHATKGEVTVGNASVRFDQTTGLFITGGSPGLTERIRMFSSGDSTFRYRIFDDGIHQWSDGSSGSADTEMSQIAAGVLGMSTGHAFRASAYLELEDNAGIGAPSAGLARHYAGGALQPGYIQPSGLDRQLQGLVYQAQAAGSTINNTTTETAFSIGTFTFPADALTDGMVIKGRQHFQAATTATPNLTLRVKLDGVTVATCLFAALNLVSATNGFIEYEITVITTGSSGTVWGSASAMFNRALPVVGGTTAAVGSVDTTGTCLMEVTAQWSAPSASNTITPYPASTITVSN